MDKDYKETICIESKGADGFIEDITGEEETMTIRELIEHLKDICDGDLDMKIFLSNDSITYKSLDRSNFDSHIIK